MRAPVAYLFVLCGSIAVVAWVRPREQDLRDVGARPQPQLGEIEGLRIAGDGTFPAIAALRATPGSGGGLLTLGGHVDHLDLEEVAIDLGDGLRLAAPRARLATGTLTLEDVRIRDGDAIVLRSPLVELHRGGSGRSARLHCVGIAVRRPGAVDEDVVLDLQCEVGGLRERLARRGG